MGAPYSKEVDILVNSVQDLAGRVNVVLDSVQDLPGKANLALNSVQDLLETINSVAIALVILHFLIVFLLILLLAAVVALIFTMDPNLSEEREALVTPNMKLLATRLLWLQVRLQLACRLLVLLMAIVLVGVSGLNGALGVLVVGSVVIYLFIQVDRPEG